MSRFRIQAHARRAARRVVSPLALAATTLLVATPSSAAPTPPGDLTNELFPPSTCELCHGYENAIADFGEPDYSPLRSWQGSLMANSARDPVFWAGVAVAANDEPGETELCIRCHAPRAFLDEHGDVTSIDQLTIDEREGVECELCHRMEDDGETPPGNAAYTIDDTLIDGINVARRGPWDFTDGVPEPPHAWQYDEYLGTSRLCGTCHDVTTGVERVDDDGVGMGMNFNEQRTYAEWEGSDYAQPGPGFRSCQDCHMPAVPDKPGCTAHLNQYTHAEGGRRHSLVGANRFVVQLLQQEYGSAGANLIADFFFENTVAEIDAFLPTSATVELDAPSEIDLEVGLENLDVTVTNNTGHKLPSGYSEGRIMWIEVSAEYAGQQLYHSGSWDQAAGTIEQDDQLRTYEGVGERWSDGTTFHLLLNDHWAIDTRIPPLGAVPNIETDPVGDRYTLQPDGTWPNFDQHSYQFPGAPEIFDATPGDSNDDELIVTVRLQYLINTPEYIDFLGAQGGEAGNHVATLFDLAGGAPPVTLAEETVAIPIIAFGTRAPATTGVDDTSTGDGPSTTSTSGPPATSTQGTATSGTPPTDTTGLPGGTAADSGTQTTPVADGGGGDGCACSSSGSPLRPSLLLWPLLLLGLRRKKR